MSMFLRYAPTGLSGILTAAEYTNGSTIVARGYFGTVNNVYAASARGSINVPAPALYNGPTSGGPDLFNCLYIENFNSGTFSMTFQLTNNPADAVAPEDNTIRGVMWNNFWIPADKAVAHPASTYGGVQVRGWVWSPASISPLPWPTFPTVGDNIPFSIVL